MKILRLITQGRRVIRFNTKYRVYFFCEISQSLIPRDPYYSRLTRSLMDAYTYTSSQKFDTIAISVLHNENWKKIIILKISKTFIFHYNNVGKLLKIGEKVIVQIHWFCRIHRNFFKFYLRFWFFFEILKDERNIVSFGCFVTKFHVTLKNFPGDWTGWLEI